MPELRSHDLREVNPERGPRTTRPAMAVIVSFGTLTYAMGGEEQAVRGFREAMSRASLELSAMPLA